MTTLADSLVSSASRKLPIRKRPDLTAERQRYQGRLYWVVKEPVGLQYYRFEEEEYAILQMLDGESSLDEIAEKFMVDFPPQTIRVEELQRFIGMLHRSGLVITNAAGQGTELFKLSTEKTHKQRMATLTNVLSIRFKGFDPDRLLTAMYPYVSWFFSTAALILCCLLAFSALTLVLVQFDVFQSRLPSFQHFFAAKHWILLAVTLGVTKVIHEFGHGLSCKHFGGECHEMGVMLLVLTPCLYCNVSDSWMLPSRWHRAAIGAAGMYVEVVMASICTFLWWFSDPESVVNQMCLNVMFVSSVSTILFNANPLLRYDGYYILSDMMEIPNLRQKASTILSRKLGSWCLGLEEPDDPFLPKRNQALFALFTVASALYRWVVVLSILYFLNKIFEPYGLKILGQLIGLMALYGLVVQPFVKLFKYFKVPGRLGKVKRARMITTMFLLGIVVSGIFFIPFPHSVSCSVVVHPRDAKMVYVRAPGVLKTIDVKPGQVVEAGQRLAQLSSAGLDLEIIRLEGQRDVYEAELTGLRQLSFVDDRAASSIAQVEEELSAVRSQLKQRQNDTDRLKLTAPISGMVLPATYVPRPKDTDEQLPEWWGSPLDPQNLNATLKTGVSLCQIGDPRQLEVRLYIDQQDIKPVIAGQKVRIMLDQSAEKIFESIIETVSNGGPIKQSPPQLSSLHGGSLSTLPDASGGGRPASPTYSATVPLPEQPEGTHIRAGLIGKAKIKTPNRTLASRLWSYLTRTFNFEL